MEESVFNWSSIGTFCKENMGTFVSILDQAWGLFKGNFRLVLTLLLEIVRLVFSSGSGFVNFLLSIVVYFTALFYLLVNSGKTYKPVEVCIILIEVK